MSGLEKIGGGFRWDFGTERGREAVRAFVQRCLDRRVCGLAKPPMEPSAAPAEAKPPCKHAWRSGASPFCAELVKVGLKLQEPFHRADLTLLCRLEDGRASNVLTAWREEGWIAGGRVEGWRRTPRFGKGAE